MLEKINTNSTDLYIGGDTIDGVWVYSYLQLFADTPLTTTDVVYSLASYLPDNTHHYEVLFYSTGVFTTSTSGNYNTWRVASGSTYSTSTFFGDPGSAVTYFSSNLSAAGALLLPILKTDQNIVVHNLNTSDSGNVNLRAIAYRRIGTNV